MGRVRFFSFACFAYFASLVPTYSDIKFIKYDENLKNFAGLVSVEKVAETRGILDCIIFPQYLFFNFCEGRG